MEIESSTTREGLLALSLVRRLRLLVGQVLFGVVLLAVWQGVYLTGWVQPMVSRSPAQVFDFFLEIAGNGVLSPALQSTLTATLIAFASASVVGTIIGIGLGLFPRVEALVDPYISAINAMPRIALAPIFILVFGIGQSAKIALAFSVVIFILIVSARGGIRTVDRDIRLMVTVANISKLDMFTKVLLPSAIPSIFSGLRLGIIYSLLGVVTSEMLASRVGLGQLIALYAGTFQLEGVYALIILLAVVASILNVVMAWLERRLLGPRAV